MVVFVLRGGYWDEDGWIDYNPEVFKTRELAEKAYKEKDATIHAYCGDIYECPVMEE